MNRPRRKQKQQLHPKPLAKMPAKDKAVLWFQLSIAFIVAASVFHLATTFRHKLVLDQQMETWRVSYHLNNEQVERVRWEEEQFHGGGNPLLSPSHTLSDRTAHHREIASLMSAEDGISFFKQFEGGSSVEER